MAGLKGFNREPRADARARRNSQNLASSVDFIGAGSVVYLDDNGLLQILVGTGLQNDGGTLKTKDSEIDHDGLSNFVANEHVDHSSVSVSTTAPLSGGGDITVTRTLTIAAATTAAVGVVKQAVARTDSGQDTVTLSSVVDPTDSPATADALRDDLVANVLPIYATRDGELETAVETLAAEFNDLLAKLRTAGVLNT